MAVLTVMAAVTYAQDMLYKTYIIFSARCYYAAINTVTLLFLTLHVVCGTAT